MPDLQIIQRHLSSYVADLENLSKHKGVTAEEIKRDTDLLWILERGIYLLIQNLFDMLAHIASADFEEAWESYSDIGEVLLKHGVISEADRDILTRMAGFRNRLSHEYLALDVEILAGIVNNNIPDFLRLMSIIKAYCRI